MNPTPSMSTRALPPIGPIVPTSTVGSAITPRSNNTLYIVIAIILCISCLCLSLSLLAYFFWPSSPDLSGRWVGYTATGERGGYNWTIEQNGNSLTIYDANNPTNRSTGILEKRRIIAPQFNTTGTLSEDGNRINWDNTTYWIRANGV